ncbi:hypothetical protein PoB_002018100 [Plakobranchus ocellatus]|uniref:Uncharacterized protein n=1 Tax=Plakobranchus ocellatus TaxID=259542 RepID=A0AAV3ZCN3_9GAST|nr:hypothetical protein PoB_002018100 [Plakobranchus ocellatus]
MGKDQRLEIREGLGNGPPQIPCRCLQISKIEWDVLQGNIVRNPNIDQVPLGMKMPSSSEDPFGRPILDSVAYLPPYVNKSFGVTADNAYCRGYKAHTFPLSVSSKLPVNWCQVFRVCFTALVNTMEDSRSIGCQCKYTQCEGAGIPGAEGFSGSESNKKESDRK